MHLYSVGAFLLSLSFLFLSSLLSFYLVLRNGVLKGRRFSKYWNGFLFFFPFFLTSVQFCFLAFGFFLFLFSIVSYFVPHPPHFTFLACDLRMCIDFALGSDFFRAANPSRIFLVISRCRERERERAQKVSVCRGRAKISAGPSPRVFVHFLR